MSSTQPTAGSPYVRETGSGYLGVYRVGTHAVELSIVTHDDITWTRQSNLVAVDEPDEPGVQVAPRTETDVEDAIDDVPVLEKQSNGIVASVRSSAFGTLSIGPGDDIRVYQCRDDVMTVVPADSDPFVGETDA